MDDRERIEALAAAGRITREEADRLLGVLDDIDQAEQQLGGVDAEVRNPEYDPQPAGTEPAVGRNADAADRSPSPTMPRRPVAPQGPKTAPRPSEPGEARAARVPEGLQWLEVSLLAGDLEIEVDPTAGSPSAFSDAGQLDLEAIEDGYRLGGFGQQGDNFLERLVHSFTRGETRVTIPADWGLRLNMKAGDVSVRGPLRFLAGHLLAGDLDADEVHGVDLNVSAGDIDLGLLIRDGNNRLHAVAGDINVRLLSGSDASVHGRVNIGDLSVPDGWAQKSKGIGSAFKNTLGEGRAQLMLELGTGDLDVTADSEREPADNG